jgi:predicted KAP-like P-loop ATPase
VRDIKRYVSSLGIDYSIVGKNEVNPIDFLGIELIRVFAPDVYTAIGNNKELFTSGESFWRERNKEANIKAIENILETYHDIELRESLKKVTNELFPQLVGNYASAWQDVWRKALRVNASDIFGRYFQMVTPSGTVSEAVIKALMATSSEADKLMGNLEILQTEGRLRNALTRAVDYLDTLEETQKSRLIVTLMNFGDKVKSEKLGMLDLEDEDTLILRLISHVLESLPPERRGEFLQSAIEESNSLFTSTHIVSGLSYEYKEYEEKRSPQNPLLNEASLKALQSICVMRFKTSDAQGTLLSTKNLFHILFNWKQWGSEDEVKAFIRKHIENKKELALLLSAFVSEVLSTEGNYKKLHKKEIGELYDIQEIDKKVAGITGDELAQMNESEKEAITLYINPPKNFFE